MGDAAKSVWRPVRPETLERSLDPEDGIEVRLSVSQAYLVAAALSSFSREQRKNRDRMVGSLYHAICEDRRRDSWELAGRIMSMAEKRREQLMAEQEET